MPRPRTISDEEILMAAVRLMGRLGPDGFTLAALGRETGLSPATLLQRFGSKRDLLLTLASAGAGGVEQSFRDSLAKSTTPIATLVDLLSECSGFLGNPEETANHLAFLHIDLTDPDFRRHMLTHTHGMLSGIELFLQAAAKKKEIRGTDLAQLARTIHITYNGTLLLWCVLHAGDIRRFMRRQLEAVIEPWLLTKRTPRARPAKRHTLVAGR